MGMWEEIRKDGWKDGGKETGQDEGEKKRGMEGRTGVGN